MKKILIIGCLLVSTLASAQKTEGVVTYVRKQYWTKIMSQMTFLSQEQKDRMTQTDKNWEADNKGMKMKLVFTPDESLYGYNSTEPDEGTYSWRKEELYRYRNFDKEKQTDVMETMGKTYIVEDSLRAPVWKIGNQIKEVAGYICMKAETEEPIKKQKITAWFAQDIPVPAGPEQLGGLPGLILEVSINDGAVTMEAVNVAFRKVAPDELKLPKLKGKKVDEKAFNTLVQKFIADSMASHDNPYWEIRY